MKKKKIKKRERTRQKGLENKTQNLSFTSLRRRGGERERKERETYRLETNLSSQK